MQCYLYVSFTLAALTQCPTIYIKYQYLFVVMEGRKRRLYFVSFAVLIDGPTRHTFPDLLRAMAPFVRDYHEAFIVKINMILFITTLKTILVSGSLTFGTSLLPFMKLI